MHQIGTPILHSAPELRSPAALRTVLAHDADQLAGELTNWQQSYDQISAGLFRGALVELRMPKIQVFKESLSQAVRQSCRVWPGAIWFGLPDHPVATRINGRQAGQEWIMVQPGEQEFELVTPSAYGIYGIVVCRRMLAEAAARSGCLIDWERVQAAEVLQVDGAARAACVQTLAGLLGEDGHGTPAQAGPNGAARAAPHWQEAVLGALLELLDRSCVEPVAAASVQRRQRVVARAREYILAHRAESISVPELCEQVHVSRRTLQYCFEDVLGMSPMLYLRMVRLNGVRRQLHDPAARGSAIGDVAGAWGLCNFSQFSSDYRKLFGECPSASMKALTLRG
ncbi:helix-turn-helix domain-containing protein [Rugamonas sp. CCM 8940]|uniref:helix-turn-helix domain-containing protein n=1 Tax=Rugamonas sp. CCM 8940 TaxID=2765359 RepID=UPI0018F6DFB3|nr:helix-turn-helix domain-containing protein [Rugamonas sp. CCM 8940]MBJ7309941.1 helix-turn-helix domain-containing protein [Rugamonas sp. CCM 8940]